MIEPWAKTRHLVLLALCCWVMSKCLADQPADSTNGVFISEFMASNQASLADGDGRFSDWLEIYNATGAAVDLGGWHLTDSPKNLHKWTFPAGVVLAARDRLVVFASGRGTSDRPYIDGGGHLHTSFRLDKDGGYLALVAPDGRTVVHAYEDYPAQTEDISRGLRQEVISLVSPSAYARYKVPAAADQNAAWTDPNYDDSTWDSGPIGLGFGLPGTATEGLIAYWPLNEGTGNAVRDSAQAWQGSLTGTTKPAWTSGPSGYGTALCFDGQPGSYVDFGRVGLNIASGFTLACWVNAPVTALGRFGVMLAKGPKDAGHFELYLNGVTGGGRTNGGAAFYAPDLGDFWADYVVPDGSWHHLAWTCDEGSIRFYANGQLHQTFAAAGQVKAETERLTMGALHDGGFPFFGTLDDVRIYDKALTQPQIDALAGLPTDVIKTDISRAMLNVNSTVWMRLPFMCSDPEACAALTLNVTAMDGFVAYLNGVRVASDNAPDNPTWHSSSLRSFAGTSAAFDLDSFSGFLRPGRNVLAIQGLNDSPDDPDFLLLPTLTAEIHGEVAEARYFSPPTPGQPNGIGFATVAEAPQFSRESGTFAGSFSLRLSSASPQARIFFTVDGSEPTQSSHEYTAPISVVRSAEIRARAYEPNGAPSRVTSRVFVSVGPDLNDFGSNLPVVLIDTLGRQIPETDNESYARANAIFLDANAVSYAGRVGLRVRGRSSTQFPKKQYKLETWNGANHEHDVPLLGLPSESDWILYAPYSDKTLMRNELACRWWERLGHYSLRSRYCEVFLNDDGDATMSYADDYVGVYLLMESIKIGRDRVDIAELTSQDNAEPEITGGYIIEMGNANPGGFNSSISGQTVEFSFRDPDADQLTPAQRQWLRDYVARFETTLYGSRFADPDAGYGTCTDVDAQIDYDLMREFTRNFDGGSTVFSVDRGGKLTMGPLWDYGMALGNVNYAHNDEPGYSTSGWNDSYMAAGVNGWCPWWYRFREDPAYRQQRVDRWFELRRGPLSDADIVADIEAAAACIGPEAAARNFARWPILGQYVWANPPGWDTRRTYRSEIDWMTQWLLARVAWLDSQFALP